MQRDFHLMTCFTLAVSFSLGVGTLLVFHTFLLLNNLSTIEINALLGRNVYN